MNEPRIGRAPGHAEDGIALIIAMMAMLLVSALGMALVLTTSTETMIAGNYSTSQEGLYAADAIAERTMDDLLTVPDWNRILDGTVKSPFIDGPPSGTRTLADGSVLDLSEVVNMANCGKATTCSADDLTNNTTGDRVWDKNNPVWTLYGYGPANSLIPTGTINSPFYVVVMVGDDPSDDDDNPLVDGAAQAAPLPNENQPATNPGAGVLALRAEAFGPRGTHKVIEMTVARTDTSELERGYTGQRGQDEQNRRARKSPVQTPGKALTSQTLSLTAGGVQ